MLEAAPSIAAVIPLFNGARWIEECLRSVFAQTLRPQEIIVVDDGSSDEGPNLVRHIAERNGSRLKLLKKPNAGQSSARNFGVRHSFSELIAFLDQDDLWLPQHLERLRQPFLDHRMLGWVFSDVDIIDRFGRITETAFLRSRLINHPRRSAAECVRRDMYVLPSASLISRKAFDKVGGFDERLSGYEDDDLFLRLFCAGYANLFVNEALSQWRFHSERSTHTARMSASRLLYLRKLIKDHPGLIYSYLPRFARFAVSTIVRRIFRIGPEVRIVETLQGLCGLSRPIRR